eukprot:TRINITY_DN15895_c0_g1_i4.p1 TRINITY_DN15895_c0_g1~~TRINITY_DN15895_c0_g1_i4.p1  ORF type:complete len:1208 (-),score=209.45 TRINITY_DN15895_c0_g1_i4:229-3852(-)
MSARRRKPAMAGEFRPGELVEIYSKSLGAWRTGEVIDIEFEHDDEFVLVLYKVGAGESTKWLYAGSDVLRKVQTSRHPLPSSSQNPRSSEAMAGRTPVLKDQGRFERDVTYIRGGCTPQDARRYEPDVANGRSHASAKGHSGYAGGFAYRRSESQHASQRRDGGYGGAAHLDERRGRSYALGDAVEIHVGHPAKWYPGEVADVNGKTSVRIEYSDGWQTKFRSMLVDSDDLRHRAKESPTSLASSAQNPMPSVKVPQSDQACSGMERDVTYMRRERSMVRPEAQRDASPRQIGHLSQDGWELERDITYTRSRSQPRREAPLADLAGGYIVGDLVDVYSQTYKQWFPGEVEAILFDIPLIVVQYGSNETDYEYRKRLSPESANVRKRLQATKHAVEKSEVRRAASSHVNAAPCADDDDIGTQHTPSWTPTGVSTSSRSIQQTSRTSDAFTNSVPTKAQLETMMKQLRPDITPTELENIFKTLCRTSSDRLPSSSAAPGKTTRSNEELFESLDKGIDLLEGTIAKLQLSRQVSDTDKQPFLRKFAVTQKRLLDLSDTLKHERREVGGEDAVAEPIRAARKEDVPRHLWLGLRWSGILRMLYELEVDEKTAHARLQELIDRSNAEKAQLEQHAPNSVKAKRLQMAAESGMGLLKAWEPQVITSEYKWNGCWFRESGRTKPLYSLACTGYNLLDVFVRPYLCSKVLWTAKSMCEIIEESPEGTDAGTATFFLSHAQAEALVSTLGALCWFLHSVDSNGTPSHNLDDEYIWVDYSSLRQLQAADFTPEKVACVIQDIGRTLVMIDEWTSVQVATRLWCTFELLNSVQGQLMAITEKNVKETRMCDAIAAWEKLSVKTAQTGADPRTEAAIRVSLDAVGIDVDAELRVALVLAYTNQNKLNVQDLEHLLVPSYAPRIQKLSITDKAASELPQEIGNLTKLTALKIEECGELKQLPKEIGNLTNLMELKIEKCMTLEQLPKEIGNLTSLTKLNIERCTKLVLLPEEIGNLTNLMELDILRCMVSLLPKEIGNLTSLTALRICANLEQLPKEIGELTNLTSLSIEGCLKLTQLPKEIGNLAKLTALKIMRCYLLEQLPKEIGKLTNLMELHIERYTKLVQLPEEIGNLTKLTALKIVACPELKQLPKEIGNLTKLTALEISGCVEFKQLPKEILELKNLQSLHLEWCESLTRLPDGLRTMPYLNLVIQNCQNLQN